MLSSMFVGMQGSATDRTRESPSSGPRDLPRLLNAKDLEALLKIDVKTIYSYVQRGLIPYVKIQSNVRFVKDDILDWIEDHRCRARLPIRRREGAA
jgi:predicted DNA-binding transcriptional regulator AlpA